MAATPTLLACRLEVLADRLTLRERIEAGAGKEDVLAQGLLVRHPELGDRVAREIVAEALEDFPCCLGGLEELGRVLIRTRGGEPTLETRVELRHVRSLLDEDQLLAANVAGWRHEPRSLYSHPDIRALLPDPILPALDEDLTEILEEPLAEVHLHLGGAAPPITFWLPLVLGLIDLQVAGAMAADGITQETRDPRPLGALRELWTERLLEAAVLRYTLAAELSSLAEDRRGHPFRFVHGLSEIASKGLLDELTRRAEAGRLTEIFRTVLDAIGYERSEDGSLGEGARIRLDPAGPVPYLDPLTLAVAEASGLRSVDDPESPALGERFLIASALRLLRTHPADRLPHRLYRFRACLLRYLRIKHRVLRLLVHYPGVHGLDRFRQRFGRRNKGSRAVGPHRAREVWLGASIRYQMRRTVLRWLAASSRRTILPQRPPVSPRVAKARRILGGTAADLDRRLEIRISADAGRLHNLNLVSVARGLSDALEVLERHVDEGGAGRIPHLQAGVVIQLQKRERLTSESYVEIMNRVLLWLEDQPVWRPLIVGVDVAAPELDAPPSRFASAYRLVTERRREGAQGLDGMPLRLGKTFHVGEDFRDLLTGIRQVGCAIELLGLEAGDRLGHALAAGLDPQQWYLRRGRSFPWLGDHLLDLLWAKRELTRCLDHHEDRYVAELGTLNRRFEELGVRSLETLGDETKTWFSKLEDPTAEDERAFQSRLVAIARLKQPADAIVDVAADSEWLRLLSTLQYLVIREIDLRGLHVETNPTSNLLIAGLADFSELPIFRFHPVRQEADGSTGPLQLSVSTDDPEVFRVNLREEYAGLFRAALDQGRYSRREILGWLDRLRKDGWTSSFLTAESPRGSGLARYLAFVLD